MAKHFFKKEIVSKPLIGPGGKRVNFEHIPGNTGLLVIDPDANKELFDFLISSKGKKGLSEISQDDYISLKKKREYQEAQRPSRPRPNVLRPFTMASPFPNDPQQDKKPNANPAADSGSPSAPAPPPPPDVMPEDWKPQAAKVDASKQVTEQALAGNEPKQAPAPPEGTQKKSGKKGSKPKVAKPATKSAADIAKEMASE